MSAKFGVALDVMRGCWFVSWAQLFRVTSARVVANGFTDVSHAPDGAGNEPCSASYHGDVVSHCLYESKASSVGGWIYSQCDSRE